MGELTESTPISRQPPFREDCWTEEATEALIEAWGRRYMEMNRGNLRQKDWQEVADAVNALHGYTKKTHRTDVQCKNRIDTIKKKYKVEKAKVVDSKGVLTSSWPFFPRLEFLIGPSFKNQSKSIPLLSLPSPPPPPPFAVPLKRPVADESYFKRNYSVMAAAAAAEEDEDDGESEGEECWGVEDGMRSLAKAIERFGEVYERVENMKQRQMMELEKQRLQFVKDLEFQRMQLFMDTQVQLEKTRIKWAKRSGSSDDIYS